MNKFFTCTWRDDQGVLFACRNDGKVYYRFVGHPECDEQELACYGTYLEEEDLGVWRPAENWNCPQDE